MATRAQHFCKHSGCNVLTSDTYCPLHIPPPVVYTDNRDSAAERGYDYKWSMFAKKYLAAPAHQFCALHISPNCNVLAECVDHIRPLKGPHDPGKYDTSNLQPACTSCNLAKGKRTIRGTYQYGVNE